MTDTPQATPTCQVCDTELDHDERHRGTCDRCHTAFVNGEADIAEGRVREVSPDEFAEDTPGRALNPVRDFSVTVGSTANWSRAWPIGDDGLTDPERLLDEAVKLLRECQPHVRASPVFPNSVGDRLAAFLAKFKEQDHE